LFIGSLVDFLTFTDVPPSKLCATVGGTCLQGRHFNLLTGLPFAHRGEGEMATPSFFIFERNL